MSATHQPSEIGNLKGARTFLSAERSGDFPVPGNTHWKTRPPVFEAKAQVTDKALKKIPQKLGL